MAGVVNLILDNHFEGVRGTAQYGISDEGDNEEYFLSARSRAHRRGRLQRHSDRSGPGGLRPHDARAAVRPLRSMPDLKFFLRVDNLFDRDPPNNIPTSYGAHDPVLYDPVGRM